MAETNRTIVVTGGSAGVGRAVVRRFSGPGARIAVLARGADGIEAACREARDRGSQAIGIETDVADPEQVEAAAERIEAELGPIDIWINNAMASVFGRVEDIAPEEFQRVTDVTYLGYVYGTLAALRRMRQRDAGTIVQVGSALAFRGIPLQAPYCAAKHAVQGFTESLRCELLDAGSAVNLVEVHLPAMNTPQFGWVRSHLPRKGQPVPPILQPEVAADAIYKAVENRSRAVMVGLSTMQTIMGNAMVPALVDRYLASNGIESQQTDEPEDESRPDNLFAPLPGDAGAHGSFDERANDSAPSLSATALSLVTGAALAGAGFLTGVAGGFLLGRRK